MGEINNDDTTKIVKTKEQIAKEELANSEALHKVTTEKAAELSTKLGVEVTPIIFFDKDTNEDIIGYVKYPDRHLQMRIMDKSVSSMMFAAADLLECCLIQEESSPRILSTDKKDDKVYIGACMAASSMIQLVKDQYKKK